ncbi:MAG: GspE/PulE family protein [Ignavibacteriales bacterium]|nr:GspE/PulE family protein [Ignavibacteriales bacterium]
MPLPPPANPQQGPPVHPRVALEQIDVGTLSRDKIRDLFRAGKLPTSEFIVEEVFQRATKIGATDIHFEPIEGEMRIRLGHEGILKRLVSLPPDMTESILSILKTRATLNQFEKKKPQEGRFSSTYQGEPYDFRVSLIPVLSGERAEVRLLRKTQRISRLEELGYSKHALEQIHQILLSPKGLILFTGPSGSGKTTSVYAGANAVETPEKCVITVEDPVEYRLPFASQVQLPADRSFGFADALRAILRQNPNVILIGEIRDAETGIVAAEAALTGNLVLSTMLSTDALGVIPRLLHLGIQPFWLSSTISGIVYQQLIRKICPDCKQEAKPKEEELAQVRPFLAQGSEHFFCEGKGCENCGGTGFQGRTVISEVISISLQFRDLILQQASIVKMRQEASDSGFINIRSDAAEKVSVGLTSVAEFVRVLG